MEVLLNTHRYQLPWATCKEIHCIQCKLGEGLVTSPPSVRGMPLDRPGMPGARQMALLQAASSSARRASLLHNKIKEVEGWMHARRLPSDMRSAVTSYFADVWVASAGACPPSLRLSCSPHCCCMVISGWQFWHCHMACPSSRLRHARPCMKPSCMATCSALSHL